ncbi:uncharacterized protein Z518_05313 [Rhinocladiella mackenziei CBS 650.93]|uniref:alpha-1,2-Mannosidase n=1 Tax=Rhinocladiella mackenziei CBS 650.93 TaxID=1442369 RepID=A0A0D2J5X1_9EURO|nr:uncharacterized protein Z518_05313 [Rhinocladiella mackenziei CBS 650.93]KIX04445.1 hypothetical protein Z518_05313 [Rhinocladiella mackenziei CBS 650.93]
MAIRRRRFILLVVACILFLLWRLPDSGSSQPGTIRHEILITQEESIPGESSQSHGAEREPEPFKSQSSSKSTPQDTQKLSQVHPLLSPITDFIPVPKPPTSKLPRVQYGFKPESKAATEIRHARLEKIKEAMFHSWNGYHNRAWLKDELAPVTGGYRTTLGGWSATLVDALDTLWLMGLKDEFEDALQVVSGIDFDTPAHLPINVFETTIRYLGGLLGAYDVSNGKYPILLQKAREVGDMLYAAFDTPNHMPVTRWSKIGVEVAEGNALIAELGSLSLEFTRLTQLTGDPKFYDAIQRISDCLESQQSRTKAPGLFPHTVNARECYFGDGVTFSIGGFADSVYEYFPKEYQLLGGAMEQYRSLHQNATDAVKKFILFRPMTPDNEDILMAGTLKAFRPGHVELNPQMQHLACFAGGMFALGSQLFNCPDDLDVARRLVHGCIWAYNQTPTGIMPELFHVVPCPDENDDPECNWDEKAWSKDMLRRNSNDESSQDKYLLESERLRQKAQRLRLPKGISAIASRGYELRPEAIESIFVFYRITGDETLRESAWQMFEAITSRTRTEWGFSSIDDVTNVNTWKVDKMESFWMAETLKYFWLLFEEPGVVSLDEFVLNTEAHPFRLQTK